jgi:hypothetical protein
MADIPSAKGPSLDGRGPDLVAINHQCLIRFGLAFAVSLVAASTAPPGLALASLNALLFLCSAVAAAVAGVLGDQPFAPHLTRWDEAAALATASMVLDWFIDPRAVEAALQAAGMAAP